MCMLLIYLLHCTYVRLGYSEIGINESLSSNDHVLYKKQVAYNTNNPIALNSNDRDESLMDNKQETTLDIRKFAQNDCEESEKNNNTIKIELYLINDNIDSVEDDDQTIIDSDLDEENGMILPIYFKRIVDDTKQKEFYFNSSSKFSYSACKNSVSCI